MDDKNSPSVIHLVPLLSGYGCADTDNDTKTLNRGLKIIGKNKQTKSVCIIALYEYIYSDNEISSRNHLWREENDVMVQMLTLPFIFDNKCPLPWTCDEFHRQDTFCTKDFLFQPFFSLILYLFTFLSFCLIS